MNTAPSRASLTLAMVALASLVMVTVAVPSLLMVSPVTSSRLIVPFVTVMVTPCVSPSESAIEGMFELPVDKVKLASSQIVCAAGTVTTGLLLLPVIVTSVSLLSVTVHPVVKSLKALTVSVVDELNEAELRVKSVFNPNPEEPDVLAPL